MTTRSRRAIAAALLTLLLTACTTQPGTDGGDGAATQEPAPEAEAGS